MKFVLVLAAVVGLTLAAPHPKNQLNDLAENFTLQQDFEDFIKLIPVDKLKTIARKYLDNDKEFQEVIKYLQGKEWAALVSEVAKKPEVVAFKKYLKEAGIDVEKVLKWIHDLISGATPGGKPQEVFGVKDFAAEIKAALPLKELLALLNHKLETSKDFQEFYKKVSSQESHKLAKEVLALKEVKNIRAKLEAMGFDVQYYLDIIAAFLGWNNQRNMFSLQQDFEDFIKLIPVDKLKTIARKYLDNDKEFQEVIKYLQGKEWAALVSEVAKKPEVVAFKKYLKEAGIDVEKVLKWIHDLISGATPGGKPQEAFGVKDFAAEIKAALPLKELLALLNHKLETSKDFQEFYKKVSSQESHKLAKEVLALKEVKNIRAKLEAMGFDVQNYLDIIAAFLGWNNQRSMFSLQQDFEDFIKLIPVDKLKTIARKYLDNDKEFQEVVKYLQGKEWAALVSEVAKKPEVVAFKKYLKEAGIDVEKVLKWIHDLISGATPGGKPQEIYGVKDFAAEIKAALPLKELLALLNHKLETSKDFQEFYKKVSSQESHKLAKEVLALKEVKNIRAKLEAMGFDVQYYLDIIAAFLGWNNQKSMFSLQQDFEDFIKLIPVDKLKTIARKYLDSDKEFQEVVKYLQGKEWAALVSEVAKKPEVVAFKKYLKEAGIDVEKVLKWIHDLISGATPGGKPQEVFGVKDFAAEIKAALPLKELLALLNHKLETSKDFQEFYKKVSSQESHKLAKEVLALKEVKNIRSKLETMGFDVQYYLDIIAAFLGWN